MNPQKARNMKRKGISKRRRTGSHSLPNKGTNKNRVGDEKFVPCIIKMLPQELWIPAAATAIKINPANAPATHFLRLAAPEAIIPNLYIALLTGKYWGSSGVRLTVGFLDNPASDLRAKILSHMNAWGRWANVQFVETATDPKVRIARANSPPDKAGYWSYIGTDVLTVGPGQPTMNLENFTMNTPDSEFYRVVRHETGHTLGFPHEHQRQEIVGRIDPDRAIAYFRATYGWTEAQVRHDVLTAFSNSDLNATAQPDINSIMCYWLPASIMRDGIAVNGGTDIDAQDAVFAASVYPKPGWRHADLSALAGATPAVLGSSLASYIWNAYKQVAYLTPDGHVHELSCSVAGHWTHADLSALAGATPAVPGGSLASYIWNTYKQLAYLTPDGHIHELSCNPAGRWTHADLTALTGGTPATAGSALTSYIWNTYKQLAYLTPDGHIHELSCNPAGRWTHADLTALTGGTPATAGSALTSYIWNTPPVFTGILPGPVSVNSYKQVAYLTPDGHVHELCSIPAGHWTHADLTVIVPPPPFAPADPAVGGSTLTGYIWHTYKQVAYFTLDGHVHELCYTP